MRKSEITVGKMYQAKVSNVLVTVRVDDVVKARGAHNERTVYECTNLNTGRKVLVKSAVKFRREVTEAPTVLRPIREIGTARAERYSTVQPVTAHKSPMIVSVASNDQVDPRPSSEPPRPAASRLASKLAAVMPKAVTREDFGAKKERLFVRQVGDKVAGMTPNEEQELILDALSMPGVKVLVIAAGAGCGKTAVLKMIEEVFPGRLQYTAYNTALVDEARAKFKRASVNTTHSLAWQAIGRQYAHRIRSSQRMRSFQIANMLGIQGMDVFIEADVSADGRPRPKHLQAGFLAGQALVAIERFCQSADREIELRHFNYIDGIDGVERLPDGRKRRRHENNDRVKNYLLPFAKAAWQDIVSVEGRLPFAHDHYVKIWQLMDDCVISADAIELDESQDTAPVMLDILMRQNHAVLIMVGDSNQQIYRWRGAVDAMKAFPGAPRRMLSQSYRFGQAIADAANSVLARLEEPTDLVLKGNHEIPSRVCEVENPRCHLYRTNAGAVGKVMAAIKDGKKPHLIGGGKDTVAFCEGAIELKAGRKTQHRDLCCFDSWQEVEEYAESDEGGDLKLMVKLIKKFTAEAIRDALKNMPSEADADTVVSTAHKSKGREWPSVKLGQDFRTANRLDDDEVRLVYVALTRAQLELDVTECPTFCGGDDLVWGVDGPQTEWIDGIEIAYTKPMPTEEELTAYLAAKAGLNSVGTETKRSRSETPNVTAMPSTEPIEGFAWTKFSDVWCLRGPVDVAVGSRARVVRRDETVQIHEIKKVIHKFDDAWIYGV